MLYFPWEHNSVFTDSVFTATLLNIITVTKIQCIISFNYWYTNLSPSDGDPQFDFPRPNFSQSVGYQYMLSMKTDLLHCCWVCKLVQPLWRIVWRFLKKPKTELPYDPQSHSWAYIQRTTGSEGIHVPHCSLQHCLQWPRHGSNLNVCQQKDG